MMKIKTYSELITYPTFNERLKYLNSGQNVVGAETFGKLRYLNQRFYTSPIWRKLRRDVILRDNGCDLALNDFPINGKVYVHHINPLTEHDLINRTQFLLDPQYLVCMSFETHNLLHYGDRNFIEIELDERKPNDTCPWLL